jgi:hypothetical protein
LLLLPLPIKTLVDEGRIAASAAVELTRIDDPVRQLTLAQELAAGRLTRDGLLADACEGVQIFGQTGGGKTSGSGRRLRLSYLRAGMGGLVLSAKADERALWERDCRETGRSGDFVAFSPKGNLRYNFLDDELKRAGVGAGYTENVVNFFTEVTDVADGSGPRGGGGRDNENYFRRATQ